MGITKHWFVALGLLMVSLHSIAWAENKMDAEVTATSTYLWRGVALSADAAMQAKLDFIDPTGIHAEFFGSNVFGGSELQVAAGFNGNMDVVQYDVGGRFYYLPQYDSSNFVELYFGISRDNFGGKISYSPDAGTYLEGFIVLPAFQKWDLALHIGSYMVDDNDRGETIAYDDYMDFSAALRTVVDGMDFEFKLSGTTLDDNEANLPTDNFRTVVSISKKFNP